MPKAVFRKNGPAWPVLNSFFVSVELVADLIFKITSASTQ